MFVHGVVEIVGDLEESAGEHAVIIDDVHGVGVEVGVARSA